MTDDRADALLAYAVMVTRDPGIAAEAVHDALVASTALADRARHSEPLVWLLALTRTECVRQLRARTVFIDTALPVTPFADPFDVLTPGDRDALCLMRRSDLTAGEGARAMGCREGEALNRATNAQKSWSEAAAVLALLTAEPSVCPVVDQVLVEVAESQGVLTPTARRRLQRHAGTCARCRTVFMPMRAEARELLDIPVTVPVPAALLTRIEATRSDAARMAHLGNRIGPLDDWGFPVPTDRADRDPSSWLRWGAIAAAISAVLLLLGLVAFALASR